MITDNSVLFEMARHPEGRFEINGVSYRPEWPCGDGGISEDKLKGIMKRVVETADELYSDIDAVPKRIYVQIIGDKTRIAMVDKDFGCGK